MDLIPELKKEHIEIRTSFAELADSASKLNGTITNDFLEDVQDLQVMIRAHLNLEDSMLYPFFETSEYEEVRQMGRIFNKEMKLIAADVYAFFDKYEKMRISNAAMLAAFLNDMKAIGERVAKRVILEEYVLFPVYARYHKK